MRYFDNVNFDTLITQMAVSTYQTREQCYTILSESYGLGRGEVKNTEGDTLLILIFNTEENEGYLHLVEEELLFSFSLSSAKMKKLIGGRVIIQAESFKDEIEEYRRWTNCYDETEYDDDEM